MAARTSAADPRPGWRTEVLAGVTTFLTMSYIAVVNPAILSSGTGLRFTAVMTATILAAAIPSVLMGTFARLPYAVAPGMGLNAFFTFTMIRGRGMAPEQALGAVVLSGLLFTALSLTPARIAIARAVPASLRSAAAGGIGVFLAFIGLRNAGVMIGDPVTLVRPGPFSVELGLFAGGLVATSVLLHYRVRGALLIGMAATTAAAAALGRIAAPSALVASPDFSLVGAFDLGGIWTPGVIAPVLTLLFTDLFDSLSTFLGVATAAGLVDERGEPIRLGRALLVDALASLVAGAAGSSPSTAYIESAAGIREGGRTGLTAVVAGLCFVPLLFLAPVAQLVPACATAPALVVVGFFMLQSIADIDHADIVVAAPAFLTLVLMPLTFSITQGLTWGILLHLALHLATGRAREIRLTLWLIGAGCVAVLVADAIA
jgi:AGZA family xanthine/uracil permease-like MFS transporter